MAISALSKMTQHTPVLLQETIDNLTLLSGQTVLDGTFGGGGHSELIAEKINPQGTLIAFDVDEKSLSIAKKRIEDKGLEITVHAINENFRNIDDVLKNLGIEKIDRALLDLGFSSDQMEGEGRGFSFKKDEPLQMTLSGKGDYTAIDFLNTKNEEEISQVLMEYGEESFGRQIASAIVERRKEKPITTTGELVEIIKSATPEWYAYKKIHPATRTFQAIRIAVNDELGALREFLSKAPQIMDKHGRLALITFHSLEDRIVKQKMSDWEKEDIGKRVKRSVFKPSREEVLSNRRSRSAKLRVFEFN